MQQTCQITNQTAHPACAGKAIIADLVPDEKRGTAYGLYAAALGIEAFPASAIAGLLWQGIGS